MKCWNQAWETSPFTQLPTHSRNTLTSWWKFRSENEVMKWNNRLVWQQKYCKLWLNQMYYTHPQSTYYVVLFSSTFLHNSFNFPNKRFRIHFTRQPLQTIIIIISWRNFTKCDYFIILWNWKLLRSNVYNRCEYSCRKWLITTHRIPKLFSMCIMMWRRVLFLSRCKQYTQMVVCGKDTLLCWHNFLRPREIHSF